MNNHSTDINEVIAMAWCDKTSFDDIYSLIGCSEAETIKLMRSKLKQSSFRLWSKRVTRTKVKLILMIHKSWSPVASLFHKQKNYHPLFWKKKIKLNI
jgi:uncharacterized protein (TIGR03643 family)